MKNRFVLFTIVAGLGLASSACEKLKARDHLNKGVQSFRNARYPDAVEHFKQAVELDPSFSTARLYLATAYMSQFIPGAESPENVQNSKAALDQFTKVLEQDPKNEVAIASIASLYFQQRKLDEAEEWNRKMVAVNPRSKEAHYTLGVIAWTKWLGPDREARNKLNMKPDDPGPLKDKKLREELKVKYMPMLDEGIRNMEKALEIDKDYDDAMAYMNLLVRYRADLLDTPEEYKQASLLADDWVQKALATKKIKAEKAGTATAGQAK